MRVPRSLAAGALCVLGRVPMDAHPFGNYRSPMSKVRGTRLDLLILCNLHGMHDTRSIIEGFEDAKRWREIAASLERLEEARLCETPPSRETGPGHAHDVGGSGSAQAHRLQVKS